MKKKNIIFVNFEWQLNNNSGDLKIPPKVPVLLNAGAEIDFSQIIDAYLYLLRSGEEKNFVEKYNEFMNTLVIKHAETKAESHNFESAIIMLKKILKYFPTNINVISRISQYYFEANFPVEAYKYAKKALKLDEKNTSILTYSGVIKASMGDLKKAEILWKKSIKIDPKNRKAWLNLLNLNNYQGKFKVNLKLFNENPQIKEFPEIANQMGITYASLKLFDKAIYYFLYAKNNSEIEIPYLEFNLAQCYFDAQNWKEALRLYQDIYKRLKDNDTRKNLEQKIDYINNKIQHKTSKIKPDNKKSTKSSFAQIAREEEYYLEIMKNIEKLKKEAEGSPRNPWVMYNLGNLYAQLGKFKEAITYLEQGVDIDSDNALIWHTLGLVFLEIGKKEKALESIKHAVICRPNEQTENVFKQMNFNMSLPYFNLGDIYISMKKYNEAKIAFEKGIEIDARSYLAHFQLGTIYEKLKDPSLAESCYRKSIILNKNFPSAYLRLAKLLIQREKTTEGIELLKQLLIFAPETPEARKAAKLLKKHG